MDKLLKSRELTALALAVVLATYGWNFVVFGAQINDDAFITFRYSQFVTLGQGPVFNPGEHVEGYSNFLLMLLMSAAIALFGDNIDSVLLCAKMIGLAGGVAAIVGAWDLARRWIRRTPTYGQYASLLACAAGAIVAVDCCFALNSTTGLETTLFAALVTWAVVAQQAARDGDRWRWAGLIFALAAWTRPEGVLVFAASVVGRSVCGEAFERKTLRRLALDALVFGALVGGHVLWRMAYYDGEIVPNTYYAKMGGFTWSTTPTQYVLGFLRFNTLMFVIALAALLPAILPSRGLWREATPALLIALASLAAVFKTGSDWMPGARLLVPYLPLWAALAAAGLALLPWPRDTGALGPLLGCVALAAGLFGLQVLSGDRGILVRHVLTRAAGYHFGHARMAAWIGEHTRPGDTVALMDVGIIGYLNPQLRILDVTGLTDRYIAKSPGAFLEKRYDVGYVFDREPRIIMLTFMVPTGIERPEYEQAECWTRMELDLRSSPRFESRFLRLRVPSPEDDSSEGIAALFGAEKVFEHLFSNELHMYLAAFARQYEGPPAPGPASAP